MEAIARQLSTYYEYNRVILTRLEAQNLCGALIIVCFAVMALDITGPEVVFLVALSVLMLAEVLTITDTLSGFANDGLITIGSLFLVIGAIEKSHVVEYGSRLAFGTKSSPFWGKVRMYVSSFFISAFFNNIPQVAIMIPIVKDWAILRGEAASQLLIPLSYTVLAGGMLATIGTSTNLAVQSLLSADLAGREQFNFFDPAVIGLPAGAALIVYMLYAGPRILPHHKEKVDEEKNRIGTFSAEITIGNGSNFINQEASEFFRALGISIHSFVKVRRLKRTSGSPIDAVEVVIQDKELKATSDESNAGDESKGNESHEDGIQLAQTHWKPQSYPYVSVPSDQSVRDLTDDHTVKPGEASVNYSVLPFLHEHFKVQYDKFNEFLSVYLPKLFDLPANFQVVNEKYTTYDESSDSYDDFDDITTIVQEGDIIFVKNVAETLHMLSKSMPWERQGIFIYGEIGLLDLPRYGREVVEVVISDTNPYVNKRLGDVIDKITRSYGAAVLTARSKLSKFDKSYPSAQSLVLTPGDSIVLLTSREEKDSLVKLTDFYSVTKLHKISNPAIAWSFYPAIMFMTIVSLVAAEMVEMCPAALAMTSFLFVGGWLIPSDIEKYVDVRLLMLMGTSISFALAMSRTGLATYLAESLSENVKTTNEALYLIYIATLVITEIISNNAAAALMYPIAVNLADIRGVSYKPFAMIVMQAASMAFMCPIGYPTHVMVWRPGQYSFLDFMKFGLVPDLLWLVISCLIAPAVWKF